MQLSYCLGRSKRAPFENLSPLGVALVVLLAGLLPSDAAAKQPLLHEQWLAGWQDRWQHSQDPAFDGKFTVVTVNGTSDRALLVPAASRRYGLSTLLPQPLQPTEGLVLQYEVQFSEGHTCGGAYIKLLPADPAFQPAQLSPKTPYTIMFGPDRCGPHSRVHLIIKSHNPKTGKLHERHLEDPPAPKGDKLTHIYTLELSPDNSYRILIDGKEKGSGDLLDPEEFFPPFQPPLEIPDPEDKKPEDWVEEDIIDDPDAVKPPDWDERQMIPDPHAKQPDGWLVDEPLRIPDEQAERPPDWDDHIQGAWQTPYKDNPKCVVGCGPWKAPMVKNPKYTGPWIPRKVDNPAYKGEWKPRNISNPDYYKEDNALQRLGPIGAVAFELWSTDTGYLFSNILLANDDIAAAAIRKGPFRKKHEYQMRLALAEYQSTKYAHLPIMARLLFLLVDLPWMAPVKPHLAPVMQVLWHEPNYAYLALLVPAVMMLCGMCVLSARRHVQDEDDKEEQEALARLQAEEVLEQQKAMSKAAAAKLQRQGGTESRGQPGGQQGTGVGSMPGAGEQQQADQEADSSGDDNAAAAKQSNTLRRRRAKA